MIQTVFGWTDAPLHQFFIGGRSYGLSDDFDQAVMDEREGVTDEQLAEMLGISLSAVKKGPPSIVAWKI